MKVLSKINWVYKIRNSGGLRFGSNVKILVFRGLFDSRPGLPSHVKYRAKVRFYENTAQKSFVVFDFTFRTL